MGSNSKLRAYGWRWLRTSRDAGLSLVVLLWLGGVAVGFWLLTDYATRPSALGAAPSQWPPASHLRRSAMGKTLLMFVHPRCPCSEASIAELFRIMEHQSAPIAAYVLFIQPAGVPEEWTDTPLWRHARQIPGVIVRADSRGEEASRFAAETSGQTLVYDAAGRLAFNGGVTAARGHYGENRASDEVLALLRDDELGSGKAVVFGCPLGVKNKPCCESKHE